MEDRKKKMLLDQYNCVRALNLGKKKDTYARPSILQAFRSDDQPPKSGKVGKHKKRYYR